MVGPSATVEFVVQYQEPNNGSVDVSQRLVATVGNDVGQTVQTDHNICYKKKVTSKLLPVEFSLKRYREPLYVSRDAYDMNLYRNSNVLSTLECATHAPGRR